MVKNQYCVLLPNQEDPLHHSYDLEEQGQREDVIGFASLKAIILSKI
jgi:hypothetical protein